MCIHILLDFTLNFCSLLNTEITVGIFCTEVKRGSLKEKR